MKNWAAAVAAIGESLVARRPLSGGDLSEVVALQLASGRIVIGKRGDGVRVEADMLRALHAAGAPVPEVLWVENDRLLMSRLASDGALSPAWHELGQVLQGLHQSLPAGEFGWHCDYAFGAVPILNQWQSDWSRFWAEQRLLVFVDRVPQAIATRLERLAADLSRRLPAQPPRSLLHGDLWGGNVLAAGGRLSGLIDPACYYGDAEVDLAMLQMFDHPDERFFAAYGELRAGYRQRLPIYRLWPALVHLALFGPDYAPLVQRLLDEAGSG